MDIIATTIIAAKNQVIVQGICIYTLYTDTCLPDVLLVFREDEGGMGLNAKSLLYWIALRSFNCFIALDFVVHFAKTRRVLGFNTR